MALTVLCAMVARGTISGAMLTHFNQFVFW